MKGAREKEKSKKMKRENKDARIRREKRTKKTAHYMNRGNTTLPDKRRTQSKERGEVAAPT